MRPAPAPCDAPCEHADATRPASPRPEPDAPAAFSGCSGEGAASAMQHWLKQHEERIRVADPARLLHPMDDG